MPLRLCEFCMQHGTSAVFWMVKYEPRRLGAACNFRIVGLESDGLVEWILKQRLPFDSLYYYGSDQPIHVSYSPQYRRNIWTFTDGGTPTRKGIEQWINGTG